jgi:hypothetical protein
MVDAVTVFKHLQGGRIRNVDAQSRDGGLGVGEQVGAKCGIGPGPGNDPGPQRRGSHFLPFDLPLNIGGTENARFDQEFAHRLLKQVELGDRVVIFDRSVRVRVIMVIVIAVIMVMIVVVVVVIVRDGHDGSPAAARAAGTSQCS